MTKLLCGQITGEGFPQVDLTTATADGLVIPLLNHDIFRTMHRTTHAASYLFSVGHSALEMSAKAQLEDAALVRAMMLGCSAFELISSAVRPDVYQSEDEKAAVYATARRFVQPSSVNSFAEQAELARQQLHRTTPVLHDAIVEIAETFLDYNETDIIYATAAAAMM